MTLSTQLLPADSRRMGCLCGKCMPQALRVWSWRRQHRTTEAEYQRVLCSYLLCKFIQSWSLKALYASRALVMTCMHFLI